MDKMLFLTWALSLDEVFDRADMFIPVGEQLVETEDVVLGRLVVEWHPHIGIRNGSDDIPDSCYHRDYRNRRGGQNGQEDLENGLSVL